jgi:hypothetical protein
LTTAPSAAAAGRFVLMARVSAFLIATPRSSPLMRCAAQSAEISSQDMPQTFSV